MRLIKSGTLEAFGLTLFSVVGAYTLSWGGGQVQGMGFVYVFIPLALSAYAVVWATHNQGGLSKAQLQIAGLMASFFLVALGSSLSSDDPAQVVRNLINPLVLSLFVFAAILSSRYSVAAVTASHALAYIFVFHALYVVWLVVFGQFSGFDSDGIGFYMLNVLGYEFGAAVFFERSEFSWVRVSGVFSNPNHYALYGVLVFVFFAWRIVSSRRASFKLYIISGFVLLSVLSTGSRTPFFVIPAVVFFLLLLKWILRGGCNGWVVFAFLGSMIIVKVILGSMFVVVGGEKRRELWSLGVDGLSGSGLLGYGFGRSHEVLLYAEGIELTFHNTYMQLALDTGIFGVLLFVLFVASVLWLAAFKVARFGVGHPSTLGILLILSVLLWAIAGTNLIYRPNGLLGFILGAVMVLSRSNSKEKSVRGMS